MSDYDSSDDDDFYGEEDEDEEDETGDIQLQPCGNCGRNFNPDALSRHYNVCIKLKPRKPFDSSKQRTQGLEKVNLPSTSKKPVKKKDWRRQHQEFIKNIRAARGETSNDSKSGKAQPSSPTYNPDYIQCPHCLRRFGESAAERHINFCKEQKSRLPKQTSDTKYAVNKEKQQKRSTYKPPLPGQKKKSLENTHSKPRNSSNSAPTSGSQERRTSSKSSPLVEKGNKDRYTKSDTSIAGQRRKKNSDSSNPSNERPMNNGSAKLRYEKTSNVTSRVSSGSSLSDNESLKLRSGKIRGGNEPKWFEDLKRNDSGNKQRRNKLQQDINTIDSGLDINDNYPRTTLVCNSKNSKESPVGVVRPSSRAKEEDVFDDKQERRVSSGRRKMANFCHECGTKYPVPDAKFCCECGLKRMTLA